MLSLIPKKYFLYLIVIFVGCIFVYNHRDAIRERDEALASLKAELADKNKEMTNSKYIHQKSLDEFRNSQDSLVKVLDKTRDSLGIRRKNMQGLQYISSTIYKTDTIVFRDTLFKEYVSVDTTIQDAWYSTKVRLAFPDTIVLSPSFRSEKHIIIHSKKETIKPPKKWWLLRLFQRKHMVLRVDVVEKSPYIEHDTTRFIQIIK